MDGSFEVDRAADHPSAYPVVFDIVPDEFVRVEFRGVRRQKEKPQFTGQALDKGFHLLGAVRGVTINN